MSETLGARADAARFWWDGRSEREQRLLAVLGGLLVVLAIWFGLVAPLRAARAAADERYEQALADNAAVERLAASLAGGSAEPAAVIQSAAAAGLSVSRQRADAQGLTLWIDVADPTAVLGWLDGLRTRQGLSPSGLTLVGEGATVRVEVSFPTRT